MLPQPLHSVLSSLSLSLSLSLKSLSTNTIRVTVTDARGCTATATVTVTEPTAVSVTEVSTQAATCSGGTDGTFTVLGAGGTSPYTYAYGTTAGSAAGVFTGLSASTYTVTATDANNCASATPVTVTVGEPTAITGSAALTSLPIQCFGGSTSVTVTASGGTPLYSASVTGGVVATSASPQSITTSGGTAVFANLAVGDYTFAFIDENYVSSGQCDATASLTLSQPPLLTLSEVTTGSTHVDVACHDGATGAFTVAATGGTTSTGSYTYSLDGGAYSTTATFSDLEAGDYTVLAKDGNDCVSPTALTVTITEPDDSLAITAVVSTAIPCHGGNGALTISATGGTSPYTYTLAGPSPVASATSVATVATVVVGDHTCVASSQRLLVRCL